MFLVRRTFRTFNITTCKVLIMSRLIYADNAATTRLDPAAFEAMKPFLVDEYGNTSQPYAFARLPKKALRDARETIASCIGASPEEIFFTSGGTESDNWAIKGSALSNTCKYATITSAFEHHAVLHPCEALERLGYPVAYMWPSQEGYITAEILKKYITSQTYLTSVMFANNEIGTVQPIKELCDVAHENGSLFHTDAVQAVGHISINVHNLGVDMLSASAHKLFVSELQYTTTIGRQKTEMNEYEIERGASFTGEKTRTQTLKHAETSQIKYDLIGKIAEGTVLTRRTVSAILQGIRVDKLYMFKNNPEEFITKVIRLINEQKATMIVEHISYDAIEGEYDSSIFTAEKATQSFDKAFLAKKAIQDYVFTDGSADKSIERKFAEDLDAADEVCVYAKLPRTFQIPTPVGNYSPDWAIAFYEGKVKHIFFIAETKGTMESLELRPIEQAKISCAKKLFNEMSTSNVVYHDVDSYQSLLNIMNSL